ncbi:MAG: citrate synthase, partial [Proteobacteria bacterium]|nr:citrate synthase [Pseudomonadota bacterium]
IRNMAHDLLETTEGTDPLLEIALKLEEIALSDDYFIERKLYPNVDFYSGLIYRAIGIPTNMFTVMFTIARTIGWIAQWREMISDKHRVIGRPRQLYSGPARRDYPSIDQRGGG